MVKFDVKLLNEGIEKPLEQDPFSGLAAGRGVALREEHFKSQNPELEGVPAAQPKMTLLHKGVDLPDSQDPTIAREADLASEVAKLKANGYKIKVVPGFCTSSDFEDVIGELIDIDGKYIKHSSAATPLDHLRAEYENEMRLDVKLRDKSSSRTALLYPFELTSLDDINWRDTRFLIQDEISGANIAYQAVFNGGKDGPSGAPTLEEIYPKTKKFLERRVDAMQAWVDSIQPAEPDLTFEISKEKVCRTTAETLEKLKHDHPNFKITITSADRNGVIDSDHGFTELVIDKQTIDKLKGGPIMIHGQPGMVKISLSGEPDNKENHNSIVEQHDFGFKILVTAKEDPAKLNTVYYLLSPSPKLATGTNSFEPLPLDIPGIGSLRDLAFAARLEPLASDGVYNFLSNVQAGIVNHHFSALYPDLSRGARQLEEFMGFKPGENLKAILILNSEEPNAFFWGIWPGLISFQDEMLRLKQDQVVVARHETAHLIDHLTGYKASRGLEEFWKNNMAFNLAINEENFLPEIEFGGHAEENSKELFASLVNSLFHPDWSNQIRSITDSSFLSSYDTALRALDESLRQCPEISQTAPIFKAIDEKLSRLCDLYPELF